MSEGEREKGEFRKGTVGERRVAREGESGEKGGEREEDGRGRVEGGEGGGRSEGRREGARG